MRACLGLYEWTAESISDQVDSMESRGEERDSSSDGRKEGSAFGPYTRHQSRWRGVKQEAEAVISVQVRRSSMSYLPLLADGLVQVQVSV